MPREKDDAQLFFKAPAKPLQGLFLTRRDHRLDADARSRTKTFPNLASFGACRRKKFPNSNPAANSAPRPLNSRNFPFAIQSFKHRQVYADGRKNKSRRDARGVFGIRKRSRRLYKRERQSPFHELVAKFQRENICFTAACSSRSSLLLASIFSRENSFISRPCTTSQFFPSERTGREVMIPFGVP